jgi:hypothetical protein
MTLLQRLALCICLAFTITSACNGGESAVVADYIDSADGYARELCECEYNSALLLLGLHPPYGSADECSMDLPANSAERGCVEGLFQDASVDYSAVLDCRAAAQRNAAACLNALTCTDTARLNCYQDASDEISSCPDLPDDVEAQLTDCLYN